MENLEIIDKLTAVIQANVAKHFGHMRPTEKGLETVRKYSQEQLDLYVKGLMKESEDLQKRWRGGHPLIILARVGRKTGNYEIVITTKDNPKGL